MAEKAGNKRWQEMGNSNSTGNVSLERLAQHFEAFNRSEGKSPRTVAGYSHILKYFGDYLSEQGLSNRLEDLNILVVRDFVLYLQTKPKWHNHPNRTPGGSLTAQSVQSYVRSLRPFFSWLHRERYTQQNILATLRLPKAPIKVVEILTDEEAARILNCIDAGNCSGSRDAAMLVTFLDSGLRLSELIGLTMGDTHLDEGYVKVMGKGAKERIVPIGTLAQKSLQRYIFHFRDESFDRPDDNLFLTLEGKPMSGNSVKLIMARIAKKSGVERLHAHLCRHTFATNYLVNGGDIFSLQQILGHTSLEMVRRYVTLASAHVRVQHRKFSPMDKIDFRKFRSGGTDPKRKSEKHRTVCHSAH